MAEAAFVEVLMSVQGCFVVHQVPRAFEALVAVLALVRLFQFVDISDVLFQRVLVRRSLPAIFASVIKLFRAVVAQVAIVRFQVSQIMPADVAADPIFIASHVSLQMLVHGIFSPERLRAIFANFGAVGRVSVVEVMLQPRLIDKLLAAIFHRARERRLHFVENVDAQQVVADHELPRERLWAMIAFLRK